MSFIMGKGDCIVIHALFTSVSDAQDMTAGSALPLTALTRAAGIYVVLGALVLIVAGIAFVSTGAYGEGFVVGALVPYVVAGTIVVTRIGAYHPFDRFGIANGLTLIRLIFCSLLGGLAFEAANGLMPSDGAAWVFCALAVFAMIVDGLDGPMARREGLVSAFGGRFDMEVDALQILLLSVVALALGKAGAWVLIGGALRYVYEFAGIFWPALRRPLPPSFRRKLMSVVEGGALAALLAPIVAPPVSIFIAAVALLLLIYSFAVDVVWLAVDGARLRRAAS